MKRILVFHLLFGYIHRAQINVRNLATIPQSDNIRFRIDSESDVSIFSFFLLFCRMPNENAPVCGCGVVVDLPKSRNGALSSRKLTIRIPKSKGGKSDGRAAKKQQDDARGKSRSSETGSCSSVTEQARPVTKSSKHEKRLNHSRRTRSADRAESHYTYIGWCEPKF